MVFVHPFAEEKKCSHRALVEAARAVVQEGWHALRFDLRGCGDSDGEFADATPSGWRADVEQALTFAAQETGVAELGLLGLQLGGALAAQIAEERPELACLVLWEPVVDGQRYVSLTMRRSALRKKLTEHEGGTTASLGEETAEAGAEIDFDGYRVSEQMHEELAAVDLTGPKHYRGPALVLNLTGRDRVSRQMAQLAATYPRGTALAVRQEPIWAAVGLVDPTPTVQATVSWLRSPACRGL